ncbi:protein TASOR-like isoform X2 [Dipodomys spectabilis]|uniref:protein TASOR-like isoform X2 n=1 Tax=Dipodomys spectabilis TaxID=105255 RepID=UPI001C54908E|nr:protein TASOR-like isoform X2 [Dipodomys spectabilis]
MSSINQGNGSVSLTNSENDEKTTLFQPLTQGSREFEDVLNILHSSYLEQTSVTNFNYKRACLVHNELLEKEFTEKRRELKFDGRLDKELSESYAFLMVDRNQGKIKSIYDPMSIKSLEPMLNKSALDPATKHECHLSKNASRITSLLTHRAYELTQYYFYEYGFDELRRRPRHICPYAVVSFTYKDDIQIIFIEI